MADVTIDREEAIATGERLFREGGFDLTGRRVRAGLVMSWAYHPDDGPVYVINAVEMVYGNDGAAYPKQFVIDAMTGDVLVEGEGPWWDFKPAEGQYLPSNPGTGYPFRTLGGMWEG